VCLIFPALSAVAEGFEVQAVLDISGSPYELSEAAARKRMELAGVQFTATNTIIAELAQDWSTAEGGQLIQLLFKMYCPRSLCRPNFHIVLPCHYKIRRVNPRERREIGRTASS